jgi:chromosome segregation ATPase
MSAEASELTLRRGRRISAEEVFSAADALLVEGHRPTIDRVRLRLGRGSPNTINEHLDRWWGHLGARLRDLPGGALPGVPEPVAKALVQLWTAALREAQQMLATTLQEREQRLSERESALARREQELQAETARHEATLTAKTEALASARAQLNEANERGRRAEQLLHTREAEREQQQLRIGTLEADLTATRQEVDSVHEAASRERRRLDERYDQLQSRSADEIDRLRQSMKEEQRRRKELQLQLDQYTQQLRTAQVTVERLTAERDAGERLHQQLLATLPARKPTARRPLAKTRSARRPRKS